MHLYNPHWNAALQCGIHMHMLTYRNFKTLKPKQEDSLQTFTHKQQGST